MTRSLLLVRQRGIFVGKSTAETVWEIAEPIAGELGLILWDVRFVKEGAQWKLKVVIDKEGGVSIDDCVNMSHALDTPLDDGDFIAQSYSLQVSSPGIERELKRDAHFAASIGKKVILKLIRPYNGVREYKGVLTGYKDGEVTLLLPDDVEMAAQIKETSFVKLDDFNV